MPMAVVALLGFALQALIFFIIMLAKLSTFELPG
jgi:hypothetical protein